jgi:signal transduction histidine kinase
VLLALIATVPLLVVIGVNASQDAAAARSDAQLEALRVAQLHANLLDEHIQSVDVLLRGLAAAISQPSTDPADVQANSALLSSVMAELPPTYAQLYLSPPRSPNAAGLIFDSPALSGSAGVVFSRPVTDRDGQAFAVLNATTRLDRLPRLDARDLPSGSVIMVFDERGVVLARSLDYDTWVGRDLSGLAYVQQALRLRTGTGEQVSADGVHRLSAYTMATRAPWLVWVGLPSEIVLGSSRVALLRNLWFGVLALGAAVVVAWLIAGRITAPLRRLAHDSNALGCGDLTRRTSVGGSDEVGVLASTFNYMAARVEEAVTELRASHIREREARVTAEAAADQLADREQRLQDLVRQLQVAQEEERRRVAYEIHDGLAQVAASAHQHLQTFADYHAPESDRAREALERTVELVQRTVREARRLIAGLRPTALDDFGLATAIRMEIEALRNEGWEITYDENLGEERLPSTVETALFRVAQEALTNVRKHAGRVHVEVTLAHPDSSVRLEVRDWGRGFDVAESRARGRPGERVGLLGMQERVAMLHGECSVTSQPGVGTWLRVNIPLTPTAEAPVVAGNGHAA